MASKKQNKNRNATRAGAMSKPPLTPNENDNQEREAIKREYQAYKARSQKGYDLWRFKAVYYFGKLKDQPRNLARAVATDLPDASGLISQRAKEGDVPFFVALGKCLNGEIKPYKADPEEVAMLELVWDNPLISDVDMVYELKRRGFESKQDKRARDKVRRRLSRMRATLPDEWKSKIPKRKSKSGSSNG